MPEYQLVIRQTLSHDYHFTLLAKSPEAAVAAAEDHIHRSERVRRERTETDLGSHILNCTMRTKPLEFDLVTPPEGLED